MILWSLSYIGLGDGGLNRWGFIFFAWIIVLLQTYNVNAKTTFISARSYIVMDAQTGQVMESKDMHLQRSVASISKIMTAILAIESGKLETTVVVPREIQEAYGSMLYLIIGDQITLEELVYGLLLRSGNDAALAIALTVSPSVDEFVNLMNQKASKLHMRSSLFRNPSGLDEIDGGNLSTAYDMGLLMAYGLKNPFFRKIVGTTSYRSTSYGIWTNKNRLLSLFPLTSGGKTGYTRKAKRTLITSARKGQTESIVVTLDCGNDFSFHRQKHESFLSTYETRLLFSNQESSFDNYIVLLPKDIYHTLPIKIWESSLVTYVIIQSKETLLISVILEDGSVHEIAELSLEKIVKEPPLETWWDQWWEWLRGVLT